MGETTKIEWCHHTFNPWIGCTKVAPECAHCYAEELMALRWRKVKWGDKGTRKRTTTWNDPIKWNRNAEQAGERRRVFCASLADVFEDREELKFWRRDLFSLIDQTPWLDWLLLTKRPENIRQMWEGTERRNNVWLGTSCGHIGSTWRINKLLECRGLSPVLFLSMEPLLTPVDLSDFLALPHASNPDPSLDWVIVGGESGRNARPCDIDWIRSIVSQCQIRGAAPFVKQLGANPTSLDEGLKITEPKGGDISEWPEDLRVRDLPAVVYGRKGNQRDE